MKSYFNILFICITIFSQLHSQIEPNLSIDNFDNNDIYDEAANLRLNGQLDDCLQILFQIKCCHLKANYTIAEIYLNDFRNYNISLDYFNEVISFIEDQKTNDSTNKNSNLYKKSLFMTSYIYSNYLGLYSKGYENYNTFLNEFPEDELIESVIYEINLLKAKEQDKAKIILNNKD